MPCSRGCAAPGFDARSASLATLPLGGDRAEVHTRGGAITQVAATAPLVLPDGTAALAYDARLESVPRSSLHLAFAGARGGVRTPVPQVKVNRPHPRTIGPSTGVSVSLVCARACDARPWSSARATPRPATPAPARSSTSASCRAMRTGRRTPRCGSASPTARPARSGCARRSSPSRRRTAVKPPRITGLSARRVGDSIRVRWGATRRPSRHDLLHRRHRFPQRDRRAAGLQCPGRAPGASDRDHRGGRREVGHGAHALARRVHAEDGARGGLSPSVQIYTPYGPPCPRGRARRVPDRVRRRARRHGRGVPGARARARPRGRAEGDRAGAGRGPRRARALPARGAGGGVDRAPQRDPRARRGLRRRARLPGDAVHRRRRRARAGARARARCRRGGRPRWSRRSPRGWTRSTAPATCTATSSPPTCSWTRTGTCT